MKWISVLNGMRAYWWVGLCGFVPTRRNSERKFLRRKIIKNEGVIFYFNKTCVIMLTFKLELLSNICSTRFSPGVNIEIRS